MAGKNFGRPEKPITKDEAVIIEQAFYRYKFGARMLEPILEGFYNIHVPHNRLHSHLLSEGLAVEDEKKKKRCKWVRYEQKHSMSAGYIDWHEGEKNGIKVCTILGTHPGRCIEENPCWRRVCNYRYREQQKCHRPDG